MGERIRRINNENIYQPKIQPTRIRDLYRIRIKTHIPMTVLLDMAIQEFVEKMDMEMEKGEYNPEIKTVYSCDDVEDLGTYLEPYQNDPYGDL